MAATEEIYNDLELRDGARILYLPVPQQDHEPVRLEDLKAAQSLDLQLLPRLP